MAKIDSITKYQELACKTFKEHRVLTAEEAMLLDWVIGLPGEVGEVCELIKHHIFHGEQLDKMKLAKELGDVLWYVNAIAKTNDIPMDAVMGLNVGKLQHRYDNGGFDKTKSEQRHAQEAKFEGTEIYKTLKEAIIPIRVNGEDDNYINILLVGNECTGKTTLAAALIKELGFDHFKGTYKEDNKFAKATNLICNAENTVFDRLYFPDEIVYRIVKRDPLLQTEVEAYMQLADVMKERNFMIIHMHAQIDVMRKRLMSRGDEFIEPHELNLISRTYEEVLPQLDLHTIHVDTSYGNLEELVPAILVEINKFKEGRRNVCKEQ